MTDESSTPVPATPDPEAPRVTDAYRPHPTTDDTDISETTAEPEPVLATTDPAAVETETPVEAAPTRHVVYVTAPTPPRTKGNRGVGSLIALLSAVLFAALLAVATALIGVAGGRPIGFAFVVDPRFYIPVLFFAVGFVLLVLIFNRASWWAYIVGSLLLGAFVYFGSIGLGLITSGILSNTPEEAAARYAEALLDPFIIVAALLAREVSMWVGAAIASRGRRVRSRNVEAREAFDRDLAEQKAEHERGPLATSSTA